MRVTQNMLNRNVALWLNRNLEELSKLNLQLSSGQRVNTFSDDVLASGRILELARDTEQVNAYMRNLESVDTMLSFSTSSLQGALEVIARVKELAVQAATETYTDTNLQTMAENVEGLLSAMVTLANVKYRGEYVFSGEATHTASYVAATGADGRIQSVEYRGEAISTRVAVGPDDTAEISLVGTEVFQNKGDVFETFINLREAMRTNDRDEINRLIGELERSHADIRQAVGRLGGRQDQLDSLRTAFGSYMDLNAELTSDLWDADIAQVSVEYNTLMARLQLVLRVSAEVIKPSIMNFL